LRRRIAGSVESVGWVFLEEESALEGKQVLVGAAGLIVEIDVPCDDLRPARGCVPVGVFVRIRKVAEGAARAQGGVPVDVGSKNVPNLVLGIRKEEDRQDTHGGAAVGVGRDFRNRYERP